MDSPASDPPIHERANSWKTTSLAALTVYWMALFVGTHWPRLALPLEPSDKLLHAVGYAGLALLLALSLALRGVGGWRLVGTVLAIAAVYGAVDEMTQPLLERTPDALDWIADMTGAIAGLVVFSVIRKLWRRAT